MKGRGTVSVERGAWRVRGSWSLALFALLSTLHAAGAGEAPVYTEWPFDASEAQRRQQATAKALDLSIEKAFNLGGGTALTVVLIPPGRFMMGDAVAPEEADKRWPGGRPEWFADAQPCHPVRLTKPFYLGKTEVTRGLFAEFVRQKNYTTDAEKANKVWTYQGSMWATAEGLSWKNPGLEQTDEHPVVCVSWNDAVAFCDWLSEKTGHKFALPTEAQWEYACRAGSDGVWPWGEGEADAQGKANVASEGDGEPGKCAFLYPFKGVRDGYTYTAPVGKFAANAFGLHDLIGNVWEWCSDRYADRYPGTEEQTDPTGPDGGLPNVVRGGSWCGYPWGTRTPSRACHEANVACTDGGFRVAMAMPPPTVIAQPPPPPPPPPPVKAERPKELEHVALPDTVQDLYIVLTWSHPCDVDLHVLEPSGERCYFAHLRTATGCWLDHDDTTGTGPETYRLGPARVPGDYRIELRYYSGRSPVNATVWVYRHFGGRDERLIGRFAIRLPYANTGLSYPIATVNVPSGTISNIGRGVTRLQ